MSIKLSDRINNMNLPEASDTKTGVVNINAQSFAGIKTFADGIVSSDDLVVDTNLLFVDVSGGKVGIGTSSPDALLYLDKNGANTALHTLAILDASQGEAGATSIIFKATRNDSIATSRYAIIEAEDTGATARQLKIQNNGGVTYFGGKVGIGISSPTAALQIKPANNTTDGVRIYAGSTFDHAALNVTNYADTVTLMSVQGNGDLIVPAGKIGIGVNPNFILHVKPSSSTADGPRIYAGSTVSHNSFSVINHADTLTLLSVKGNGNVHVGGALSKGSGSFKIDHPLEAKKDTHHLVHSFVEAPQADNIYRGRVALVNGQAIVNIDEVAGMTAGTFSALNREVQAFTTNESGWTAVKGSVVDNVLTITAQDTECSDTISWLVIGERKDKHMYDTTWTDDDGKVIVEPEKEIDEPAV